MCLTDDEQRGKIKYRKRAQQIRDFSGLKWGKITPTDIDAFMDFEGTVMVFVEFKSGYVEIPYGQRLAFERIVRAINTSGYINCIFIKAIHNTPDTSDDVSAAEAIVVSIFDKSNTWNEQDGSRTVKQVIDSFLVLNNKGALVK